MPCAICRPCCRSAAFPPRLLSGELGQHERNLSIQALRDGRARVCVATDVAARGLDLPDRRPRHPRRPAPRRRSLAASLGPHRPRRAQGRQRPAGAAQGAASRGKPDRASQCHGRMGVAADRRRHRPARPRAHGPRRRLPGRSDRRGKRNRDAAAGRTRPGEMRRRAGAPAARPPAAGRGSRRSWRRAGFLRARRKARAPARRRCPARSGSVSTSAATRTPIRNGCCRCSAATAA